jgi:hypothetical protein
LKTWSREILKGEVRWQNGRIRETLCPFEELHELVECIRKGLETWFSFLVYPGMEPTNNLAEAAIR